MTTSTDAVDLYQAALEFVLAQEKMLSRATIKPTLVKDGKALAAIVRRAGGTPAQCAAAMMLPLGSALVHAQQSRFGDDVVRIIECAIGPSPLDGFAQPVWYLRAQDHITLLRYVNADVLLGRRRGQDPARQAPAERHRGGWTEGVELLRR